MAVKVGTSLNYSKDCDVTDQLLKRRNEYTPDFLDLKLKDYQLVFVYGTLKTGQKRNSIFKNASFLGEAYTATTSYIMENSEMDFPVAYHAPISTASASLLGEIYAVHPMTMLTLDKIESNGEMYERKESWFYLLDQTVKNTKFRPSVKAWVYLGKEDFWESYPTTRVSPTKIALGSGLRPVFNWNPTFSSLEEMWNGKIPF